MNHLVTAKILREYGHTVLVFEQANCLGGTWHQGWEKLYCNAFFISQNNNIVLQCMLSSNQLLLPGGLMQSIIAMF